MMNKWQFVEVIDIELCKCYFTRTRKTKLYGVLGNPSIEESYGVCYGTRECDECSCGGDPAKCDFYPDTREKHTFDKKGDGKQMNTAQMWLAAKLDGKTYKSKDMLYSLQKGFHDKKGFCWAPDAFKSIEEIMNCQWVECKQMTRAEAEKQLGVDIID